MAMTELESRPQRISLWPAFGVVALVVSLIASVFVGAANITVWDVFTGGLTEAHRVYLVKMLAAMVFALGGTALFLAAIRRVPKSDTFVVPLIGIMLGSVIGAVAAFLAMSRDLLQMLNSWMLADFSAVLAGRYELLWLVAGLGLIAYIAADRFTVAGLGEDVSTGLGLDHRTVVALGMSIVAAVAAVVVVTVGALPLLGLVVPNVVSRLVGDDARRGLPLVAMLGAVTVLVCDMMGRSLPGLFANGAPGAGEIPVGTIVGVLGGAVFLAMMLKGVRNG